MTSPVAPATDHAVLAGAEPGGWRSAGSTDGFFGYATPVWQAPVGPVPAGTAGAVTVPAGGPGRPGQAGTAGPAGSFAADRPGIPSDPGKAVRSWPLFVLAAPAAVAVWSGWVGIGRMTGFGLVRPLPGIWDSLHLDSAVTLPIGVEAYAAYALRACLCGSVSRAARRFAGWSAAASLLLGMAGQIAYHLLAQAGAVRAPWGITTAVSCLPVLVLGMGAALAHLLRAKGTAADGPGPAGAWSPDRAPAGPLVREPDRADRPGHCHSSPDRSPAKGRPVRPASADRAGPGGDGDSGPPWTAGHHLDRALDGGARRAAARDAASRIAATGQPVSRRRLRAAGLHGSNADLGTLARVLAAEQSNPRIRQRAARPGGPRVRAARQ